jgi:5'-nucleotidase
MENRTILAVNDDGIDSPGLHMLAQVAQEFGSVYVVAPQSERSGIGKAITLGEISVRKYQFEWSSEAYAVDGTPADAVLLGIQYLLPKEPDIILSGVNLGPNLGIEDFFDSGTIGAAVEGAIHGKIAIALSLAMSRQQRQSLELQISGIRKIVNGILSAAMSNIGILRESEIVSINIPYPNVKGIRPSILSKRALRSIHHKTPTGYAMKRWELDLYPSDDVGTDVSVVRDHCCVSVSVLNLKAEDQFEKASRIVDAF